jgi:hypothetical protein
MNGPESKPLNGDADEDAKLGLGGDCEGEGVYDDVGPAAGNSPPQDNYDNPNESRAGFVTEDRAFRFRHGSDPDIYMSGTLPRSGFHTDDRGFHQPTYEADFHDKARGEEVADTVKGAYSVDKDEAGQPLYSDVSVDHAATQDSAVYEDADCDGNNPSGGGGVTYSDLKGIQYDPKSGSYLRQGSDNQYFLAQGNGESVTEDDVAYSLARSLSGDGDWNPQSSVTSERYYQTIASVRGGDGTFDPAASTASGYYHTIDSVRSDGRPALYDGAHEDETEDQEDRAENFLSDDASFEFRRPGLSSDQGYLSVDTSVQSMPQLSFRPGFENEDNDNNKIVAKRLSDRDIATTEF